MDEDKLAEIFHRVKLANVPKDFSLFLVFDRTTIRIGYRKLFIEMTREAHGFVEGLRLERGKILEAFSRLEFMINEMLKFELLGTPTTDTDWSKRKFFDEIMNHADFSNRINWLCERMNLGEKLKQKLHKLRKLRNAYAHTWREEEIQYKKNKPIKTKACFKEFKDDFRQVWKSLCDIYKTQQKEIEIEELILPFLIKK